MNHSLRIVPVTLDGETDSYYTAYCTAGCWATRGIDPEVLAFRYRGHLPKDTLPTTGTIRSDAIHDLYITENDGDDDPPPATRKP